MKMLQKVQPEVASVISCDRILLALAFLLPPLTMMVNLTFGILPWDADYFEYIGWILSKGGRMYADIWDCKGPCLYYFYALGHWLMPMVAAAGGILSLALWEVSVGLVHRMAKRDFASVRPGLCALLFVLFAQGCTLVFNLGRQEVIGVVCALVGMSLLRIGEGMPPIGWERGIGFGVCVGIAFMTKASLAAFGGVPLVLLLLRSAREDGFGREFVRFAASSFVGFAATLCALSVLLCGSWENFLQMVDASMSSNAERNRIRCCRSGADAFWGCCVGTERGSVARGGRFRSSFGRWFCRSSSAVRQVISGCRSCGPGWPLKSRQRFASRRLFRII